MNWGPPDSAYGLARRGIDLQNEGWPFSLGSRLLSCGFSLQRFPFSVNMFASHLPGQLQARFSSELGSVPSLPPFFTCVCPHTVVAEFFLPLERAHCKCGFLKGTDLRFFHINHSYFFFFFFNLGLTLATKLELSFGLYVSLGLGVG